MLVKEWTHEDDLKVAREDGWEKGREEGWEKGREDGWEKGREKEEQLFSSFISQSASLDDLKRLFEASLGKK
jgi:flagellar biosynthesis/type III secretory pathway protein FliH